MAKDPAFLFYSSDFLTGTMFMSNEQLGIYIRLLCSQHQHGGLIDKTSFNSLVGQHDIVKNKFIETESGFYNERLAHEMHKRTKKSNNLSNTAKDVWAKRKAEKNTIVLQSYNDINTKLKENDTNVIRIENENEIEIINENINENKTKIKKALIPNFDEFLEYAKTKEPNVDSSDLKLKYDIWLESDWSINRSGKYQKIVYWKSTLLNTLPYIKKLTVSSGPQKAQRNQYL